MYSTNQPEWPRITVVTPSFNQAPFLEQCIRSVLDQRYANLEYLILDGGSTDGSVEIIRRHEAALAHWASERDGGQSAAINSGFRRATGDVVAWLNADDFYLPGALVKVAEAYRANPDASIYFGDGCADAAGNRVTNFFPEGHVTFHEPAYVYGLNYILQPAAFINRRHLEACGYLDPALKYGMDSDLWIRLAHAAPPVPIPDALAASREYGETKTMTGSFPRVEELRQISEKYSGVPMTPGALLYFVDTLNRLAIERPDIYSPHFLAQIEAFWMAVSRLLGKHGARPDGFPAVGAEELAQCAAEEIPMVTVSQAEWAGRAQKIEELSGQLRAAHQVISIIADRSLARRLLRLPRRVFRALTRARAG